MKKKLAGFILLIAVMAVIGIIYAAGRFGSSAVNINGYVGGEKIELLEDPEVQKIFKEKYDLEVDYSRAGSLDMMAADLKGRDYLFPSSSIALEYYEDLHGNPVQSEIVLSTPIVLYTHQAVLDAFERQGLITSEGGSYFIDMAGLLELMKKDAQWADIGLTELYGRISVDTTDPSRSNSGNMFAALAANVLNGGRTVTEEDLEVILPQLKELFGKLGYMETSSSDLFNQFLRMGIGAEPVIAGYESQLIEYAALYPKEYDQIREDIVMLYPTPTVWSSHVVIALDENGQILLNALLDSQIQEIAWKKHGFRTGNYQDAANSGAVAAEGVAPVITQVAQVPSYSIMKVIIEQLQ